MLDNLMRKCPDAKNRCNSPKNTQGKREMPGGEREKSDGKEAAKSFHHLLPNSTICVN